MALFKATDEFKKYKAIDVNTRFESLLPFIDNAEEEFIRDLLGDTLYEALAANYKDYTLQSGDNNGMNADLLRLLPYVQRPLANYAFYYFTTEVSANVGESGMQMQISQNTQPAPEWLHTKILQKTIRDADFHADKLLAFLEENKYLPYLDWSSATTYDTDDLAIQLNRFWKSKIDANLNNAPPTDPEVTEDANWIEEAKSEITFSFEGWEDSPCNTIAEGMILQNAKMASDHIDIHESRRIFLKMKRFIITVEDKEIRRLICDAQYERLVAGIKAGDLTAAEDSLIDMLRPIIAKEALWLVMPTIPLLIEPDGLFMFTFNDSTISKIQGGVSKANEMIKNYRIGLREGMTGYDADIHDLKQFLLDNIDTYPLIKASSCYTTQPDPGPTFKVTNYPDRSHLSV